MSLSGLVGEVSSKKSRYVRRTEGKRGGRGRYEEIATLPSCASNKLN